MTLQTDVAALGHSCFDIEDKLPTFFLSSDDFSDQQIFVRCCIVLELNQRGQKVWWQHGILIMPNYVLRDDGKPSDMFVDSLRGGGATQIECCCGKYHIAEDLEYASIEYKTLSDQVFVTDCSCNSLKKYEEFIWSNRDSIRRYLRVRIDREFEWAEQERLMNLLIKD